MMKRITIIPLLIITLVIMTSCQMSNDITKKDKANLNEKEKSFETDNLEDKSTATENVSPEFDEQGNPIGDYAQYLWEQQQLEDAKKSMAEEAMEEIYEDEYNDEPHGLPY